MMKCTEARATFSSYLDGAVTGTQMREITSHLEQCGECSGEYTQLRGTQQLLARAGRRAAPPELAFRIRVALAREAALHAQRRTFGYWWGRVEDALNGMMLPATAGVISAVVFFGLVIGFFALPVDLTASDRNVGSMLYTPAVLQAFPLEPGVDSAVSDVVEVEALVDENGRVQDYRILSAPAGSHDELRPRLNKVMIFTTFRPATSFGRPMPSRVLLSFSKINVKG